MRDFAEAFKAVVDVHLYSGTWHPDIFFCHGGGGFFFSRSVFEGSLDVLTPARPLYPLLQPYHALVPLSNHSPRFFLLLPLLGRVRTDLMCLWLLFLIPCEIFCFLSSLFSRGPPSLQACCVVELLFFVRCVVLPNCGVRKLGKEISSCGS